jgi:ubiquinone/menaquinone biosynthesis C-methylase UbiE
MNMNTYESVNAQQEVSERDLFTLERYRQFYKYFPVNTVKVLDLGCNTGRGGDELKRLNSNLEIYGLDCVQDRLNKLSTSYSRGIYGLSTQIPTEDNYFDVVCAGEFIEHLYPADVDQTLIEVFRVLKIGGRLLLTTPNPLDIKKKLRGESVLGLSHVSQHFPDALKLKLRMIGFSNIKILGSGKTTRYLGDWFPFLHIYGSYLGIANKR